MNNIFRPRVFLSSVMEGFKEYRQAARKGIIAAGGEPVLIEDFPALSLSPRNACLDGVASCDILISVIGSRGGTIAPSGKLVVEEEYEEALSRKMPIMVFVEDVGRDEDSQRLVEKLSHYVEGFLRPTFMTPEELEKTVREALAPIFKHFQKPKVSSAMLQEKLMKPHEIYNETGLRFILAPERTEEVFDAVALESPELELELFEIGHSAHVGFFSFKRPKTVKVGIHEIVIIQSDEGRYQKGVDEVLLEVTNQGVITIDANVTGRRERVYWANFDDTMTIDETDIADRLQRAFAFANAFWNKKDQFMRYGRLWTNAALSGIGDRTMKSEPRPGRGYRMGLHGDAVIPAFDQPQLIARRDLENPEKLINSIITLFRRRLAMQRS